jgi:hypothetical protein
MKLTKSILRKLIKEQIAEAHAGHMGSAQLQPSGPVFISVDGTFNLDVADSSRRGGARFGNKYILQGQLDDGTLEDLFDAGVLQAPGHQPVSEVGGLGRAMGAAMSGFPGDEDTGAASSLEDGVQALIRNWNPSTPEGQRYLEELEALAAQFQGGEEREYVTLRDPDRLGQQLAFERGKK